MPAGRGAGTDHHRQGMVSDLLESAALRRAQLVSPAPALPVGAGVGLQPRLLRRTGRAGLVLARLELTFRSLERAREYTHPLRELSQEHNLRSPVGLPDRGHENREVLRTVLASPTVGGFGRSRPVSPPPVCFRPPTSRPAGLKTGWPFSLQTLFYRPHLISSSKLNHFIFQIIQQISAWMSIRIFSN